jgi:hypothetical protein
MDFLEAFKAMKMGNKVSREIWRGTVSHWYRSKDKIVEVNPSGNGRELDMIGVEDILADDWFLVT